MELVYLGCNQKYFYIMTESGRMATVMAYDVEELVRSCVDKYCGLAKGQTQLRSYSTPFILDDHAASVVWAAGVGPVTECPWSSPYSAAELFGTYVSVADGGKSAQGVAGQRRC